MYFSPHNITQHTHTHTTRISLVFPLGFQCFSTHTHTRTSARAQNPLMRSRWFTALNRQHGHQGCWSYPDDASHVPQSTSHHGAVIRRYLQRSTNVKVAQSVFVSLGVRNARLYTAATIRRALNDGGAMCIEKELRDSTKDTYSDNFTRV